MIAKKGENTKYSRPLGAVLMNKELQKLLYLGKQEIERLTSQVGIICIRMRIRRRTGFLCYEQRKYPPHRLGLNLYSERFTHNIGFGALQEDLFRHLSLPDSTPSLE